VTLSEHSPPGPDLRRRILGLDPSEVGIAPTDELPRVWGTLLDMSFPTGWASLVTLADGTTSLYTSAGGGVIGGGAHQRVATASARFLRLVEAELTRFEPTDNLDPPEPGQARYLVLTYDGIRAAGGSSETLASGADPLSPIFAAGQHLITELRLATTPASDA
jgi:hypothetical protein